MARQINESNEGRGRVKVGDLVANVDYPVGRYQPNGLPSLKSETLPDEVIAGLQGPAAMLDF